MPTKDEVMKVATDLRRQNRELEQRLFELTTLYSLSKDLFIPSQLDELFEVSIQSMRKMLKVSGFCLMLLDSETGELILHAAHGFEPAEMADGFFLRDFVLWKPTLEQTKPTIIDDLRAKDAPKIYRDRRKQSGSLAVVPLRGRSPLPFGLLMFRKSKKGGFEREHIKLYTGVGESLGLAIEKAQALQNTLELSNKDPLTGLYNRRYMLDRFDRETHRADRYERELSLAIVDIDDWRKFIERYGRLSADVVLDVVADTLSRNLRRTDVVARFDEAQFMLLLTETPKDKARKVAEKLVKKIASLKMTGEDPKYPPMTVTIGLSAYRVDGKDAMALIDAADKALYYGKALGKNRVCDRVPPQK